MQILDSAGQSQGLPSLLSFPGLDSQSHGSPICSQHNHSDGCRNVLELRWVNKQLRSDFSLSLSIEAVTWVFVALFSGVLNSLSSDDVNRDVLKKMKARTLLYVLSTVIYRTGGLLQSTVLGESFHTAGIEPQDMRGWHSSGEAQISGFTVGPSVTWKLLASQQGWRAGVWMLLPNLTAPRTWGAISQ